MSELSALVANPLRLNQHGVYECEDAAPIDYSDGRDSERYLIDTFAACSDLGSESQELQDAIRDWPSEYHLSWRRAQLFRSMAFDRSARVLEVGCGCGAISRFLGETFDNVVSIEGASARAEVARKRCADLDSVSIICAPFQEIRFKEKFDLIFCIGVFEYSRAFVGGEDPYREIVRYFADQLTEDGQLVLAIENQFGLKYFASASEDHTGIPYDGIEGYHRRDRKARTFGKPELGGYLEPDFPSLQWFYPFPDYKLPDAVYSEELLDKVDIAPLLAAHQSRDFLRPLHSRFDERLAWRDICRNGYLPALSHSYLVLASRTDTQRWVRRADLATITNRNRSTAYHTRSRIYQDEAGEVRISKQPLYPEQADTEPVAHAGYDESWQAGESLHQRVLDRAMVLDAPVATIFTDIGPWWANLKAEASNGTVAGDRLDAIWQNSFPEGESTRYIDLEWRAVEPVPLKRLLIRAVYRFLVDARTYPTMSRELSKLSTREVVSRVAGALGETVTDTDITGFIESEARLRAMVSGADLHSSRRHIRRVMTLPQAVLRGILRAGQWSAALLHHSQRALRLARRVYHGALGR